MQGRGELHVHTFSPRQIVSKNYNLVMSILLQGRFDNSKGQEWQALLVHVCFCRCVALMNAFVRALLGREHTRGRVCVQDVLPKVRVLSHIFGYVWDECLVATFGPLM